MVREPEGDAIYLSCAFLLFYFMHCLACGRKLGGSHLTIPFARSEPPLLLRGAVAHEEPTNLDFLVARLLGR